MKYWTERQWGAIEYKNKIEEVDDGAFEWVARFELPGSEFRLEMICDDTRQHLKPNDIVFHAARRGGNEHIQKTNVTQIDPMRMHQGRKVERGDDLERRRWELWNNSDKEVSTAIDEFKKTMKVTRWQETKGRRRGTRWLLMMSHSTNWGICSSSNRDRSDFTSCSCSSLRW